ADRSWRLPSRPSLLLLGLVSLGFLVPRQDLVHPFPGREEVEGAEILLQFHRLIDDALLLLVVAHLDIAGERKILPQRMSLETLIGEETTQIGMTLEIDAVEVPGLALVPAGGAVNPRRGRHRILLVGHDLDADALVQLEAQEIVDDLEA